MSGLRLAGEAAIGEPSSVIGSRRALAEIAVHQRARHERVRMAKTIERIKDTQAVHVVGVQAANTWSAQVAFIVTPRQQADGALS